MAENEREITTVFRADISNFTAATQQLNRDVALVNSEFKNATASMGRWSDNTDGLKAKLTQLNGTLDAEKKQLGLLQAQYDALKAAGKENTAEAQRLSTAINNQSAKVKATQKQIDGYSASLNELESAGVKTTQELDKLTNSAEKQGSTFKSLASGLGKGLVRGIAGIATAATGAVTGFLALGESTREQRKLMGQLETAFTTAGFSAETAQTAYAEFNSVLGDTGKSTETLQHLAMFAKSEDELANYTNILTGVYAKFGESIPTEGLAEGINHTIQLGEVQGTLADALEWGGVNLEDFNAKLETLDSEQERSAYIQKTLNELYGEAATQYKEVNKDIIAAEKAQTNLTTAIANLGKVAEPIMTMLKQLTADFINELEPFIKLMGDGLQGVFNGTAGAAEKLAQGLNGIFTTVLNKVTDLLPKVVNIVAELIPQVVNTILNALPNLLSVVIQVINQVLNLIGELLPQILVKLSELLPVLINQIVAAIPQILQAIITIVQAIVDALPTVITNLINALPSVISTIIDAIIQAIPMLTEAAIKLFNSLVEAIPVIIEALVQNLPYIINTIIDAVLTALPQLLQAAIQLFMALIKAIPVIISALVRELPKIITTIVNTLTSRIGDIVQGAIKLLMGIIEAIPTIIKELNAQMPTIIKSIVTGLIEGIPDLIKAGADLLAGLFKGLLDPKVIWDNIKSLGNSILTGIKSFFGIESPSKLMRKAIGKNLGAGIGVGLLDSEKDVQKDIKKFNKGVLSSFNYSLAPNVNMMPALAAGGIVTSPTLAMVGEAGKEAIMPLENNTEWLDKLADKLASKMGRNTVNNFNYTFEKMETTKLALHKAQLETKRIIGG